MEHVLWTAFYHCLNTYGSNHEFLSVLDKNNNLIVDLKEGTTENVSIPEIVFKEYKKIMF